MFIDASALTAILCDEPDGAALLQRIDQAATRLISPLAVWETTLAVARVLALEIAAAERAVEAFIALAAIRVIPVAPETRSIALDALARYGKARHPAGLNFGDCFAYACARQAGVPLLFKGDDFAQTDIEPA